MRTATWDYRCRQLRAYRERHGTSHVRRHSGRGNGLALWLSNAKRAWKRGVLSPERVRQLVELGVMPGRFRARAEQRLEELRSFHAATGRWCPPKPSGLAYWVCGVRYRYRQGTLSEELRRALDEAGFVWAPSASARAQARWDRMAEALGLYRTVHGHAEPSRTQGPQGPLAQWLRQQRRRYREGTLPADCVVRLESMGVTWQSARAGARVWETRYAELEAFARQHGHCRVFGRDPDMLALANWVHTQRFRWRRGKLPLRYVRKLERIGFEWVLGREAGSPRPREGRSRKLRAA